LSAEVARLHSQLEKGGVARQNVEYELAKVNKELAAERRQRLERDAAADETAKNLRRTLILALQISTIVIQGWCQVFRVLCGHPLPMLANNWTCGAAHRHTAAPISHTRPSPHEG